MLMLAIFLIFFYIFAFFSWTLTNHEIAGEGQVTA